VQNAARTAEHQAIADMLHWVGLLTGEVLRKLPHKFPAGGRADALLLENLRFIRGQLLDRALRKEFIHDLLARIIFTQFLFHRKDTAGRPFFDEALLESRCGGALRKKHTDLASILGDKRETRNSTAIFFLGRQTLPALRASELGRKRKLRSPRSI
jgi:hypothetical protein